MKKEISIFVGSKIKDFRKKKGYTQKELGNRVGVKHNTISSYEKGTNEPEQNILYAIANTLGVSINDFFPSTDMETVQDPESTYKVTRSSSYPYLPTTISAGLPLNVESIKSDDIEQITLPDAIMGKWAGTDVVLTKVNGESMNNIIPDQSLIAIKTIDIENLNNGDIVVYSDGNDYSVKRYYKHDHTLIFRPDSTDIRFTDYITSIDNTELKIHGKVVVYVVELK